VADAGDGDDDTDQEYFQAVEAYFVALRGAPLLLSPTDWQVARRWHRDGVTIDVVRQALDDVFARRKARGARGRISSLRYCMPAVEAAWAERSELTAPGARVEAETFDTTARLTALAASLPDALPDVVALRARLASLAAGDLDAQEVEERLADLDRTVLDAALEHLDPALRADIDATLERSLASLAGRLAAAEIEQARDRLTRQVLRQRLALPTLSLFSPEALGPEPAESAEPAVDDEAGSHGSAET
jgi:hypothetical protein